MKRGGGGGGLLWQLERRRKYYCMLTVGSGRNCLNWCNASNVIKFRNCKLPTSRTVVGSVVVSICFLYLLNSIWRGDGGRGGSVKSLIPGSSQWMKGEYEGLSGLEQRVSPRVKSVNDFKGQALLVNPSSNGRKGGKYPGFEHTGDSNSRNVEVVDDEGSAGGYNLVVPDIAEQMANSSVINKIMGVFAKADVNKDELLSVAEVSKWINIEIKQHFSKAMKENFEGFFSIDKDPRNGRVEWTEYLEYYLERVKYSGPRITPGTLRNRTLYKQLPKNIKVDIAALEARWSESATNDPAFLTVDEYLAFNHPEASPSKLLTAVQDTFSTFDLDGDGTITKTEFDTTYAEAEGVDPIYKQDLKLIDTDNNSKITRLELMRYMDPKNMIHSDKEAGTLVSQCDEDKDGHVSLVEVFRNVAKIVKTKFYDIDLYFHANQLHS